MKSQFEPAITDENSKPFPRAKTPEWKVIIASCVYEGKRRVFESKLIPITEKVDNLLDRLIQDVSGIQFFIDAGCKIKPKITTRLIIKQSDGSYMLQ